MLDDRILDQSRRLIESRFAERREILPKKVSEMKRGFQIGRMECSSPESKAVCAACEEEIRTRAAIVLESIQKAHNALGSPITKTLAADLKQEVSHHIEKIVKEVFELLSRRLKPRGQIARPWELESIKREVKERIDVEVDLYVDSLVCKPADTGQEGKPVVKTKTRNRSTKAKMDNRNRTVAVAAAEFKAHHDRLPSVDDIVAATEYSRQQVYNTNTYKEGKIAKGSARAATEMTGGSVAPSEHFDGVSEQHARAERRSRADQDVLDELIDEQHQDCTSKFVK